MDRQLVDLAKELKTNGSTQDEILKALMEKSNSITDAVIAIRNSYGIGLGQAKDIVASSPHWRRIHEANAILHETLEELAPQKLDDHTEN